MWCGVVWRGCLPTCLPACLPACLPSRMSALPCLALHACPPACLPCMPGEGPGPGSAGKTIIDLQDKTLSDAYDVCFTNTRVLAAVDHVLGGCPFHSVGVNSFVHAAWGMDTDQGLHTDGRWSAAGHRLCCNTLWALDEFTEWNGPTRVIAGSHLWGTQPQGAEAESSESYQLDEVRLLLPVGSVVVFDARLWHSATANPGCNPRASLQAFWSRRYYPAELDDDILAHEGEHAGNVERHENVLCHETWNRIDRAARVFFDPPKQHPSQRGKL